MAQLSSLSPKLIWQFFEQICSIPHPSKHEAKLSAWIVQWAQGEGLAVKQDAVGNIIIKKPATPGMENRKAVVLQAHIDMVPQANADTQHDFTQDPIDAYIDGEWVTARGTTLGADNGMGMAGCLAVLAEQGVFVNVVSMPSTNVFDKQDAQYQASVLPQGLPRIAVEAGVSDGWYKYVGLNGAVIGLDRFGESAPAELLFKEFGFTVDHVVEVVKNVLSA